MSRTKGSITKLSPRICVVCGGTKMGTAKLKFCSNKCKMQDRNSRGK